MIGPALNGASDDCDAEIDALVQHVATELESGMTSLQPLEAALPRSA